MSGRRGHGEGAIYREGPYWVMSLELGRDPTTGKRVRRRIKARTKAEAMRRADELRRQIEAGLEVRHAAIPLAQFLEDWLANVVAHRVDSANTVSNYTTVVRSHIVPGLGQVRLSKLAPVTVDRFLAAKAAARYSKSYVGRMRSVLADALSHAERRGLVTRNAARLAVMPKCEPTRSRRSLTLEEARALLQACRGERLEALVVCGLTLGLRPGELTGLLWSDVDLDAAVPTLTVSGSMKRRPDGSLERGPVKRSTAGQRTVAIPAIVVDALRSQRKCQDEDRELVGEAWREHGLVFATPIGTPLDPSNLRRVMTRVAARAGMEWAIPYMLRHSAASLLIDQGVSIEAVADLLGDDPRTLYRHYRHRVRPVIDAAAPMQVLLNASRQAPGGHSGGDGPPNGPPWAPEAEEPVPE